VNKSSKTVGSQMKFEYHYQHNLFTCLTDEFVSRDSSIVAFRICNGLVKNSVRQNYDRCHNDDIPKILNSKSLSLAQGQRGRENELRPLEPVVRNVECRVDLSR
jgi:hypothetical protein